MASIPPKEIQERLGTIQRPLSRRGKPNTLSVCMIVKNEEENIERAIRSFLPFADEIVVNDTGSTDRTLEILHRLPKVKIIQSEWKRDFSYSRNLSLEAATCAWCLWMDADDVVPPEQVINFNKLKHAPLDRAFGFQIINTQGGGLPVGAHFMQIRMFPNHSEIRFERRIHEQIIYGVAKLGLHVFYTETTIWHMGYEQEDQRKAKSERNLDLLLNEPDRGIDPVISTQLGDAYMILGRYDESIVAYREVLTIPDAEQINPDAYHEVFITIGKALQAKGEYQESLHWFEDAERQSPDRLDPVFYRGESLFRLGKYEECTRVFERALGMPRTHSSQASHWDVMRMYSYKYLCDVETLARNPVRVLEWASKFHQEFPLVVEAPIFMGKSLLALGKADAAIPLLEKGIQAGPTANRDAWFALMLAHEKAGSSDKIEGIRKRMTEAYGEKSPQPGTPLLSVALIVKNEEAHLEACLNSIRGLWDELIVVDTGSTDRTVQIAEAAGARVSFFSWVGDFSAARNKSLEACHGQWILWLDADDILLPEDLQQLRQLVEKSIPRKAYGLMVKNSQDGGITGPVFNQIRLFPNNPSIRFEGRVHEQVMPSLQQLSIPVEFLSVHVIHTGYTDPQTIQLKQQRNMELMKADLEASAQNVNAMKYFALANSYFDLGQYAEAFDWYRKSMDQAERVGEDKHILEIIPVKLAECRGNMGFKAEALQMMNEFLQRNPLQPNALFLRAQINESLEYADAALADYGCLMHFQEQPTLMPVDYQQMRVRACKFLADYWVQKGQRDLALEILRMGVTIGKGQIQAGLKLASLYFDHDILEPCRDNLRFARLVEENASVLLSLGQVLILLNDVQGALEALECGARRFPTDVEMQNLLQDLKADLRLA